MSGQKNKLCPPNSLDLPWAGLEELLILKLSSSRGVDFGNGNRWLKASTKMEAAAGWLSNSVRASYRKFNQSNRVKNSAPNPQLCCKIDLPIKNGDFL